MPCLLWLLAYPISAFWAVARVLEGVQRLTQALHQEVFEQFSGNLPHGTFPAFGNYVPFNGQPVFTGPPTPPDQQLSQPVNGVVVPPALLNAGPPSLPKADSDDRNHRQGSNSDEDELTPAQSRRKAQNRAAYVVSIASPLCHIPPSSSLPYPRPPSDISMIHCGS